MSCAGKCGDIGCACGGHCHMEGAAGWSATRSEPGGADRQGFDSSALRQLAKDLILELWNEHQPLRMYDIAEKYLRQARGLGERNQADTDTVRS